MTTILVLSIIAAVIGAQDQIEPIYPDVDFVRPATRNRKGMLTPEQAMAKWPRPVGVNAFPNKRIPIALRTEATLWFRRIIAEQLLPTDLDSRLKGCRLPKSDVIYDRYGTPAGLKLQLIENEVEITVSFRDDSSLLSPTTELVEGYAKSVAAKCFVLSPSQIEEMTVTSKHWPDPTPDGFWNGILRIQEAGLIQDQLAWWNQIIFQTDGDSIEFFVKKWMPGNHPMNGQGGGIASNYRARPYRGRFDGEP